MANTDRYSSNGDEGRLGLNRNVSLITVPSSAGASWPGLEKGPAAYRTANIVERLREAGVPVEDLGDLPIERWRSALTVTGDRQVNNVDRTIAVAQQVKSKLKSILEHDQFALVLGGDCTITVGAVAGALDAGLDPALVYVDGGWDLLTPATTDEAHLDGMGVAHLLARPHTTRLKDVGPRMPMLGLNDIVFAGQVVSATSEDATVLHADHQIAHVPAGKIRDRGANAGTDIRRMLPDNNRPFLLHFDVDVIDFFELPVADVPEFSGGSSVSDIAALIATLASDERCRALIVTEFNPDHSHPDGREADVLVNIIVNALTHT